MEQTKKELLDNVLSRMPLEFSSNEFAIMARKKGISESFIFNGGIGKYLHLNCKQAGTKRTWRKVSDSESNTPPKGLLNFTPIDRDKEFEQECISYLKSRGFKVMKPKQQWEEV